MYLKLLAFRLKIQADWIDKYGYRSFMRMLEEGDELEREEARDYQHALFSATQAENSIMMRRAMDNFGRDQTAPTHPMRETIMSYAGQGRRSKLVRPLDDEDVIILPK